jgi:hypothetical protein
MTSKELKKLLDYCLNVKECSKCDYAKEEDCMLTCSALIKECLKENYAEVVRCKDCIHWGGVAYGFVCRKLSGIETKICMGADHFCSYGKRKDS